MRTWVVFQLPLKHVTRRVYQNLALIRPRRSPSSHSFSSQNYQNGNFSIVQRHRVAILPNAPTLLSLYCRRFCTGIQLFEEMLQRALHGRDIHFELVVDYIRLSLKRPTIVTAIIAHCAALKIGVLAHLSTSTSLLTVYSKAGDFTSSRDLFDEIHNRDVIAWNAIIAASLENNSYWTAMDFFEKMIKAQTGFDSTTLLLMISASLHTKNFDQGRAIHCLSIKFGMLVDISLGNALIDMYAKCGDLSSSECLFEEMEYKDAVSWNSIMRGSLYNCDPEKSLYYFKKMTLSEEKADNVSLSCAISASSSLGELAFGQSIHGLGIKLGYKDSSYVSVANSLISLYSQCGDIEVAENVFRGIAYKDIVSWNAMMEGFASNEKINEVFDLLIEMQIKGSFQPDMVTLTTILPLCSELMLSREGRTIHGFAIRRQMVSDHLPLLNSLIDMYSKCNLVDKAQLLFNSTTERDIVSWNAMISGYSQNKYSKEAQNLFRELLCWGPNCSSSTVFAILSSCSSLNSLHFGKSVHCWQLKSGFLSHIILVNFLMHMYINCGDLRASFSILHENSALADMASWNTVIVGCVRGDHFREALETFRLMRQQTPFNYDSITLVSVLSACANLELFSQGKSLHGLALKAPLGSDTRVQNSLITMYDRCRDINSARVVFKFCSIPNICSWNCMISALTHNRESREALELFNQLQFKPNEITIVGVLSACTQIGFITHGKQVHAHVFRSGIQDNSFISAALVDLYSNCGRLDTALQVFRHSEEKSESAWNSMISAYGYHGNGEKAIKLFHEMWESGTRVTKSTFVSLLSACSHAGLVNKGLWYYECMLEKYGVQPEIEHQVYVVDMLGRSGRLDEAYEFAKGLQSKACSGVWGTLLSACNYHGELKLGKQIAERLFELEPQNVGYYISLANMYVAAGSWKDATNLRQFIQDQGLRKSVGYSLIDVGFG
ncbi:pentatricopeptide repeat-containing protein At4g19220, mitochondrial [Gastrolobium bilobum]|uniref:pentatricopeptide repeat-containing protein At4g19220, mitochondrial n=1 Tax=Gastrolobium bilobum TaxID=150636 RepID=UPI002AB0FE4D|nr:pentatricopeptide repeat-containing protein At4g19220, mitochondrial [Gastrolobium bilobum]